MAASSVVYPVVALTGAGALGLQVTWQRVLALRSGVDLLATTLTVAAFLFGLGLGSALGGALADRLGARRSASAFVGLTAGVSALALVSVPVLTRAVPVAAAPWVQFAVTFAVVAVPTVLMGATLPLLVRAVVADPAVAGAAVGRLVAVNTLGGAAGAIVTGWYLVGTFGMAPATWLAGGAYGAAALLTTGAFRAGALDDVTEAGPAPTVPTPAEPARASTGAGAPARVWPWLVVVMVTGAVALGLQTVFFRVVDAAMRSNAYSFPYVLAGYLTLWSLGAAVGSRLVRRVVDRRRWFLGMQLAVAGVSALCWVVLIRVVPLTPLWDPLRDWFNTDGLAAGFGGIELAPAVLVTVVVPLVLMALPVVCMGAALPFAQALVTRDLRSLGRRTGLLGAAQFAGNVGGTLLTGLVLLDRLGTGGTARVLAAALVAVVVAAALLTRPPAEDRRSGASTAFAAVGVAVVALLVAGMPGTRQLWSFLHDGSRTAEFLVDDDRSCGTVVKVFGDRSAQLHINGASQNGYPFDDFHVLVGLTPALVADDPSRALVVGLGAGSTTAGVLADPQVRRVDTVELCGGIARLLRRLAPGRPELASMLADPRSTLRTGDGRTALQSGDRPDLDVVVTDTMRTTSSASGNTFSVEYYRLIRDRLAPDGVMATWIPNGRVLNSVQAVFPHVAVVEVGAYNGSRFVVASNEPLDLDPQRLRRRFDEAAVPAGDRERLWRALSTISAACDPSAPVPPEDELNRDLHPRDEYFLNNPGVGAAARPRCPE
ncbi:MAG: hypothetical protein ACOYOP_01470 [Microthrixaceae bacterium]